MPKKVLVAMSGGVDSSFSAAALKAEGFCVVGVFLRLHSNFKEAEEKAKAVAKMLNIDFCVFDWREEFRKKIINYFVLANQQGITPNPCVVCNREIKFGMLFESLKEHEADYLATGHYVKLKEGRLFRAKDKSKDQSYFLWQLNQDILKKAIFPNGNIEKKKIKEEVKKLGLPILSKESQEICFINEPLRDFFKENLKTKKGKVINTKGEEIAEHNGLWFYTIGQRKGIGLSGGPYFVLEKDIKNNVLIVTKNEEDLLFKEVNFKNASWILGKDPEFPMEVRAKIRYHHPSSAGVIDKNGHFVFLKPQKAPTPGQSIVFYLKEELIGGGTIL
jgi:tRNA-uridine 2-sulfurtransferase